MYLENFGNHFNGLDEISYLRVLGGKFVTKKNHSTSFDFKMVYLCYT